MEIDKLSGSQSYFNYLPDYATVAVASLATVTLVAVVYFRYIQPPPEQVVKKRIYDFSTLRSLTQPVAGEQKKEPVSESTITELPKPQLDAFEKKESPRLGRTSEKEAYIDPKTPAAVKTANLIAIENITPETMRAEGKALLLSTLKTNQEKANLHVVLADHLFSLERYEDACDELNEGYKVLGDECCPISLLLLQVSNKRDLISAAMEESLLDNSKIVRVFGHLDLFNDRKENPSDAPVLNFETIIGYPQLRKVLPTAEKRSLLYYILAANLMGSGIHDLAELANNNGLRLTSLFEQGDNPEIVHKLQVQGLICKHFQENEKKVTEEVVILQQKLNEHDIAKITALQAEIDRLKLQIQERETPQIASQQVVLGEDLLARLREEIRVGFEELQKHAKQGPGSEFLTPNKDEPPAGPPPPPPPPPPPSGAPPTPMNLKKLIALSKSTKENGEEKKVKVTGPPQPGFSLDTIVGGLSSLKPGKARKITRPPPLEVPKSDVVKLRSTKDDSTPVQGNVFKQMARNSQRAKKDAEELVDGIFSKFEGKIPTDGAVVPEEDELDAFLARLDDTPAKKGNIEVVKKEEK